MRIHQVRTLRTLALLFPVLAACRPAGTGAPPLAQADWDGPGAGLYQEYCIMCHLDGSNAPSAPPLVDSPVLKESPEAVLRVLLHGSANQSRIQPGFMPAQNFFTDAEAADLTRYVRAVFAGKTEPVPPSLSAQIRAERKP